MNSIEPSENVLHFLSVQSQKWVDARKSCHGRKEKKNTKFFEWKNLDIILTLVLSNFRLTYNCYFNYRFVCYCNENKYLIIEMSLRAAPI